MSLPTSVKLIGKRLINQIIESKQLTGKIQRLWLQPFYIYQQKVVEPLVPLKELCACYEC
eukprot:UN12801